MKSVRCIRRIIYYVLTLALTCFVWCDTSAQVDTVFVCNGEAVALTGPADYATYAWTTPVSSLNQRTQSITFNAINSGLYVVASRRAAAASLIVNGGFEAGNAGFTSEYTYTPNGTLNQASYAVLARPSDFNSAFGNCMDQTATNGLMYVADGSTVNGQQAWCQEVNGIVPGADYAFSAAIAALVSDNPSRLSFSIDGVRVGPPLSASSTICAWQEFYAIWTAPAATTQVELCIENLNTSPSGNDFVLDNIEFQELEALRQDSFYVEVIEPVSEILPVTLCSGERYTDNGLDLAPGETGNVLLTSAAGCDSNLTVVASFSESFLTEQRVDSLCPGETLTYDGIVLSRDTTLCRTFTTSTGCDSIFCLTLQFFNTTALEPIFMDPNCFGEASGSIAINILAGTAPYQYLWQDGSRLPILDGLSEGDYSVEVTDAKGCVARRTFTLTDPQEINILRVFPLDVRCANEATGSIVLTGLGGTGRLNTVVRDGRDTFAFDAVPAGTFTVSLVDTLGCSVDTTVTLVEPELVTVTLTGDTQLRLGESARHRITARGEDLEITWTFDTLDLTRLVVGDALSWTPPRSGVLSVEAVNLNGCDDVDRLMINVVEPDFDLFPNAFSPNQDGSNDTFGPANYPGIDRILEFRIGNRWGNILYERFDCNPRTNGPCSWNGLTAKGDVVDSGVYIYYARVQLINGTILERVGDITLVGTRPH